MINNFYYSTKKNEDMSKPTCPRVKRGNRRLLAHSYRINPYSQPGFCAKLGFLYRSVYGIGYK